MSSFLGIWRSSREERRVGARAMQVLDELGAGDVRPPPAGVVALRDPEATALARALMAEPRLLLLDEPASGLSESEMEALGRRIRGLTERMAVLLVEHHMDLVMSVCDRIVVLNFGQVIAQGSPDAIRSNPDVASAYLGDEVHESAPTTPAVTEEAHDEEGGGGA